MIKSILNTLELSVDDIDAFAASEGPGSFTGVRIGMATLKGLAFGKDKKCVGVSTLEALSRNIEDVGAVVCPVMNARRGQVYTAIFKNGTRVMEDRCMLLSDLLPILEEYGMPVYFVGDGYELAHAAHPKGAISTPEVLRYQSAYSVGKLAYEKICRGEYTTDEMIRVEYLRKPQAEREREERLGGKNG